MDTDNAAAELWRLDTGGLLALFTTLEAPTIAEIDGEYTAALLAQPNLFAVVTKSGRGQPARSVAVQGVPARG